MKYAELHHDFPKKLKKLTTNWHTKPKIRQLDERGVPSFCVLRLHGFLLPVNGLSTSLCVLDVMALRNKTVMARG
jgi:hypothetical protein